MTNLYLPIFFIIATLEEVEELDLFTGYLSHVILSRHVENFSKYAKKNNFFFKKLHIAALNYGLEFEANGDITIWPRSYPV